MAARVFQFGDCTINIATRELLRGGERINLSPAIFDCIAYLIEHRERAVGRDELVAAVWGRTEVSDTLMGKTILSARRAIGDTAEQQRFLRTVPRFGYQWGAPTRAGDAIETDRATASAAAPEPAKRDAPPTSAPAATPAPASVDASSPEAGGAHAAALSTPALPGASRRAPVAIIIAVVCALLLALLALILPRTRPHTPDSIARDEAPSLEVTAVLPVDVAAAPNDGWLRLGAMDLVSSRLREAGLAVLPSDNVVRLVPEGTSRDTAIASVRGVAARARVIAPLLRRDGAQWIARADLFEADAPAQAAQAEGDSAIAAAGALADRLLEHLGRHAEDMSASAAPLSHTELLQRVDAARLAGDPAQARALIGNASAELKAQPDVQLRVALIDLRTGAFDAARSHLVELAASVPEERDAVLRARIENALCVALTRLGEFDAALRACDRAIALFEPRAQPLELGHAYTDRGITHELRREYDLGATDYARARIALTLANDALGLAKVDGNESVMDMARGRYGEAAAIQRRVGDAFARFGMVNERVASLNNQSSAYATLLQALDALRASDEALALLPRVTDASVGYYTKLQRAEALVLNGRLGEARVLLDEIIAAADAAQDARMLAYARASEARLDGIAGQPGAALLLARQAIAALTDRSDSTLRAGAWLSLVRSLHALDRAAEADDELRAFGPWAAAADDPVATLYWRLAEAETAAAAARADAAHSAYANALAIAKSRDEPALLVETAQSYGRFLIGVGDLGGASDVIGLAARYAETDFDAAVLQGQLYRALGHDEAARSAFAQARKMAGERALPAASDPSSARKPLIGNRSVTKAE